MSATDKLIEEPADIDQIATRIAGYYLGAPISCAKLYREIVGALIAERASAADTIADLQAIANSHSLSLTAELERRRAAEAQLEALRVALAQIEAVAKDRSEKAWFRLDTIADIAHYAARALSDGER